MGGLMGSLVGMLAAIPAAAALKAFFIYFFERSTGRRIVSEDGVFFKGAPYAYEHDHLPDAIADATSPHPAAVETIQRKRIRDSIFGFVTKKDEKDKKRAHVNKVGRSIDDDENAGEPSGAASDTAHAAGTAGTGGASQGNASQSSNANDNE